MTLSSKEIYSAIVQLLTTAENASWNRFYNFLMANSILILAWATLFVSNNQSKIVILILISISLLGGLSGIFFMGLGVRGRKFLDEYQKMLVDMENNHDCWPKPFNKNVIFVHEFPYGWCGSRYVLKYGPLGLTIFYVILFLASICGRN